MRKSPAAPSVGPSPGRPRAGLADLEWPGRVELVSENPPIVIDAAHNGASAEALAAALAERFPGRKAVVILAIAAHKDQMRVIDALAGVAREFVVTTIDSPRSEVADELAANVRARTTVPVHAESDRPSALALGRKLAGNDLLVITGSFYLAGELRSIILESARKRKHRRADARRAMYSATAATPSRGPRHRRRRP